ncbi:hypothetical protein [Microvirga sp. CF3016]|uniref:hypothetical protein n=1 Tax=Microvirga sp. CF3016 TaxID=3110181 RepID=UPI002E77F0B5|nr:hypothetical protein [Microvirga sp. CF3016]MEE1611860.1 hypothetical protein [Microvirga sp. CF3016]
MNKWVGSLIALATVLVIRPDTASAFEQYLCIGEKATGFNWNGSAWVQATFKVDNDKFLIQETEPTELLGKTFNVEVKRFGSDRVLHQCERGEYSGKKSNRIICGGLGYGMLIDAKSLRYQEFYGIGYIDGKDEPGNTPSLTLGTCTRLK